MDAFAYAVEAQKHSLSPAQAGRQSERHPGANNEFLARKNYKPELRLYAHGQGYDLVETAFLPQYETMKIKPGMNVTVHPARPPTRSGPCLHNYMVGSDGPGECLHRTPEGNIVVS